MKLALFSTLLLSLTTVRVAAMPSAVSKDTKADEYATNQLAVRGANEVAAAHLDPITASVVFSLVTTGFALAVEFVAKQIAEAQRARQRAAQQGVVITYGNGENIVNVMSAYADRFRDDHPEYSAVLLVTDGAIVGTPTLDYTMAAVEFVDTHDPEVNLSTFCVTIVSTNAGFLAVDAAYPDGKITLWQARGNIIPEINYYDPNAIVPRPEVGFTFRG